jgi:CheY-like chemotaxis protein
MREDASGGDDRPLVLVVEDDVAVREVLVETLVGEMRVVAAAAQDGYEALAMAAAMSPAVALVDLGLPGLDGLSVIERLCDGAATRSLPVLAMTALGRAASERQAALDAGCAGILEKPFDLEDLIGMVGALLRGEALPKQRGR